ncbi:MAG: HU family DNA-binding protein [Firmicutes bacterium]|nr:HU family DNA-binding protein [Bacillota bacterium]
MNKSDLVNAVSAEVELSKKDTEKVVNAVFKNITDALAEGDKVQVIGFGTFSTRKREARKGRNPATREEITIPATTVPVFKAGKGLKDRVKK